jgi:hypothetical protein
MWYPPRRRIRDAVARARRVRIGAEKQGRSFRGRTSGVSSFRANATGVTAAPLGDVHNAQDPGNEALNPRGAASCNFAGRPTSQASPSAPPAKHRSVPTTSCSQRANDHTTPVTEIAAAIARQGIRRRACAVVEEPAVGALLRALATS